MFPRTKLPGYNIWWRGIDKNNKAVLGETGGSTGSGIVSNLFEGKGSCSLGSFNAAKVPKGKYKIKVTNEKWKTQTLPFTINIYATEQLPTWEVIPFDKREKH